MNFNPSKYNTIQISLVFKQMKEPIPPRTDCLHRKQPQSGKPQQTLKGNCHNWSLLDKQYGDCGSQRKKNSGAAFFSGAASDTALPRSGPPPTLHGMPYSGTLTVTNRKMLSCLKRYCVEQQGMPATTSGTWHPVPCSWCLTICNSMIFNSTDSTTSFRSCTRSKLGWWHRLHQLLLMCRSQKMKKPNGYTRSTSIILLRLTE